jgi:hypothetical protein
MSGLFTDYLNSYYTYYLTDLFAGYLQPYYTYYMTGLFTDYLHPYYTYTWLVPLLICIIGMSITKKVSSHVYV